MNRLGCQGKLFTATNDTFATEIRAIKHAIPARERYQTQLFNCRRRRVQIIPHINIGDSIRGLS